MQPTVLWVRKTKPTSAALAIAAVVLFAVAGCGVPTQVAPTSSSPTPTAACPSSGTEPLAANCVQYDGNAAMAANEGYRQRRKLTSEMQQQLEQHISPARKALDSPTSPASAKDVEEAFAAISLSEVQTDDRGNGVRFGVAVPSGGCLYGFVPHEGEATVQAGGSIMDGGCLEMVGH